MTMVSKMARYEMQALMAERAMAMKTPGMPVYPPMELVTSDCRSSKPIWLRRWPLSKYWMSIPSWRRISHQGASTDHGGDCRTAQLYALPPRSFGAGTCSASAMSNNRS